MAIKLDLDMSSVIQARKEVEGLYEDYNNLKKSISQYQSIQEEGNRLTIAQAKELESLNKQMKDVNSSITQYETAIDNIDPSGLTQTFQDIYGAVVPLGTELADLTDQLQMMTLAGDTSSERFKELSSRVGDIKIAIEDTDKSIAILASNKGIRGISTQVGALGSSLLSLDFKGAAEQADALTSTLKGLDLKKVAGDVMSFGKSISKTLVTALKSGVTMVWQFTAALLANPITWIVVGVAALVAGLYLLLKAFGGLEPVMDTIKKSFQWLVDLVNLVIKSFKDFTDYLGITNHAETELAEKRNKRAEAELDRITKISDAENNAFSNELKILSAKGINTEEEIRLETELKNKILFNEKAKTEAKIKAMETSNALLKTNKKLSDEERKKIEEQEAAIIDLKRTVDNINTDIEVNTINQDKRISDINKKANDDKESKLKDHNSKMKGIREKADAERLKQAKLKNDALKIIEDINFKMKLDAITNEYDRKYKEVEKALEKERDQLLSNTQLTEAEIKKIKDYFEGLRKAADKERADNKIKSDNELSEKINNNNLKIESLYLQKRMDLLDKDRADVLVNALEYEALSFKQKKDSRIKERDELLKDETLTEEQVKSINDYYRDLEIVEEEDFNDRLKDLKKEFNDKDIQAEKDKWNNISSSINEGFDKANLGYGEGLFNLQSQLSSSLLSLSELFDKEGVSNAEKAAAIAGATFSLVQGVLDEVSQKRQEALENMLANEERALSESQGRVDQLLKDGVISQEEADKQKYQLALATFMREEALKKKAFEQDKKMKIAQATIGMVQGMISAYMGAQTIPIVGPVVGAVLAAAVGAMGIINIAKIKKTNYEGGTPPSAPSMGAGSVPDVQSMMMETGESNNYSEGKSRDIPSPNDTKTQKVEVDATVSVSELESTQNRLNRYEKSSEL